jgi:hypothetical protein
VGRPTSASAAGESCLQLLGRGDGATSCCYAQRRPASSATCCSRAGATSESSSLHLLTRGATSAVYCCFSCSHMMVVAGEMLPPALHARGQGVCLAAAQAASAAAGDTRAGQQAAASCCSGTSRQRPRMAHEETITVMPPLGPSA